MGPGVPSPQPAKPSEDAIKSATPFVRMHFDLITLVSSGSRRRRPSRERHELVPSGPPPQGGVQRNFFFTVAAVQQARRIFVANDC
jgi:hypothetical protein